MPRDIVCIYTGQGAAGDFSKIAVRTGQFSSCSPVIMFNKNNCRGGLYHLPGQLGDKTKLKNDEWENLTALLDIVKPTKILLFPCGDYQYRQAFLSGQNYGINVTLNDDDFDQANDDLKLAKELAFDRLYKGDQRELGTMFSQLKTAQNLAYNVKLKSQSYRGIQVTADNGKLLITKDTGTEYGGKTYDLKKSNFPPKELCAILNPKIDYSLWNSLS